MDERDAHDFPPAVPACAVAISLPVVVEVLIIIDNYRVTLGLQLLYFTLTWILGIATVQDSRSFSLEVFDR
jgi:hypothetical protein